ncbi:hypothetical protein [Actinomadura harenae]|uniref:Serine/threonine protein kinase n=1 Tax=Actinomadura harenae TaxID=2483351 RepID=A0A3M2LJ07_9ACTN|nr:hypothetical protein [Actinomadura harenae]RMI37459.1 hypothetical protein EBO15_35825 [Actinomadura harenae]
MEPNAEPLQLADPRLIGGLTLTGRLGSHGAGTVFLGEDHRRRQVVVGVLYPTAAADPGVRARLASAVGAYSEDHEVAGSSTNFPPIWVALPSDGGGMRDVLGMMDAAALSADDPTPANVPAFAPPWSAEPHTPAPAPAPAHVPPPSAPRGMPVAVPIMAFAALILIGVGAVLVFVSGKSGRHTASGSHTLPAPITRSDTPGPSPTSSDTAEPPGDDKAHVEGPVFGGGDKPYLMKLSGFPFDFNVPDGWGCIRSDKPPFSNRWVCAHEGKGFPPTGGTSAGGLVALQSCPSGCGPTQREAARNAMAVTAKDWRATDPTTQYAEETGTNSAQQNVVRVAMSHVFASRPGGPVDTAVAVQLTGPPDEKGDMQKVVNDIRHRAA